MKKILSLVLVFGLSISLAVGTVNAQEAKNAETTKKECTQVQKAEGKDKKVECKDKAKSAECKAKCEAAAKEGKGDKKAKKAKK